jgi:hypothetical protein
MCLYLLGFFGFGQIKFASVITPPLPKGAELNPIKEDLCFESA